MKASFEVRFSRKYVCQRSSEYFHVVLSGFFFLVLFCFVTMKIKSNQSSSLRDLPFLESFDNDLSLSEILWEIHEMLVWFSFMGVGA